MHISLFDDVIIHDYIPIDSMTPVQQTALFAFIEEEDTIHVKGVKRSVIYATLSEVVEANNICGIPNTEKLKI